MPDKTEYDICDELTILKEKNNKLEEDIKQLQEKNIQLDQTLNKLISEKNIHEKTLSSYRKQFQTLFFDYELKPKGILKHFQDMGVEMITFISNVCEKYELEYWLDSGTLLGAVRHDGYIPWDDDLDLGMIRKDFNKFIKVFDNEIMRFDLENNLKWSIDTIVSDEWVQSFIKLYYFDKNWHSLGGLDIFPYDILTEKNENTEKLFYEEELHFHKKIIDGIGRESAEKDYYKKLGLDYDKGQCIIPGVDTCVGNGPGEAKFCYHNYDDIFPLKDSKFCDTFLKCPNNSDEYLKKVYGDYYHLPRIIHEHNVIERMHKIPKLEEEYIKELKKIRYINNNFD